MKCSVFAGRNVKEIFRDPLSLIFSLALPVLLIVLAGVLNLKIPAEAGNLTFSPENFVPAGAVFGFSFITMFSGMLIAKDRCTSFLSRLYASPMKPRDYIIGYSLSVLPLALLQSVLCFAVGFCFGLKFTVGVLYSIVALLPCAAFFTAAGLLFGCLLSDKSVGGVSSIMVQCTALLSGMWFDLSLFGKAFKTVMGFLPFANCVDAARLAYAGEIVKALPNFAWCVGYALLIYVIAVIVFKKKMVK